MIDNIHAQKLDYVSLNAPTFIKNIASSKVTPWIISIGYILIVGFFGLKYHVIGDYEVETDFYWTYAPIAESILEGNIVVDDFKGPGYPFIIALGKLFLSDLFKTGILVSILSAGLILLITYLFYRKVFSGEIAFLVTFALICNTAFVRYSYTVSTDMVFSVLILSVIYLSLWSENSGLFNIIICSLLSAIAFLVRYNAVSIILAFVVIIFLLRTISFPKRISRLLVYGITTLIFVLPWLFFLHSNKGEFFYQKNHLNMAYEIYGKGVVSWDQWWLNESHRFQSFYDVITYNPIVLLQRIVFNFAEHLSNDLFWLLGILWGILCTGGFYVSFRNGLFKPQMRFLVFCILYFLFLVPFFYSDRFSLPLLPFYFFSGVIFILWLSQKFKVLMTAPFFIFLLLLLYGLSFHRTLSYNIKQINAGPVEVLEVAEIYKPFINNSRKSDNTVIARKPHIAYYLNMKFHPLPDVENVDELLDYCRINKINFIFISTVEAALRPKIKYLLDYKNPPPKLLPVAVNQSENAVLYKIENEVIK